MKALTIIQPFAHLIALPESHPEHKRVENRHWLAPAWLVGQELAIHAGLAKRYDGTPVAEIAEEYDLAQAELVFGAVVAVARVVARVQVVDMGGGDRRPILVGTFVPGQYAWLQSHQHCEGPYGIVLANVRPLPKPLPWKGAQGLWNIPDEAIRKAMEIEVTAEVTQR